MPSGPLFTTAKVLGWLFGMATLPLAWALTRRALPDREDTPFHPDFMALIAPFGLAMSVQFTVWNSSGLENSLFCFLLALGLYRCVVELEDGGKPYSALVFFLLCASRPEGIMYALIALGLRLGTRCSRMRDVSRPCSACARWCLGLWS